MDTGYGTHLDWNWNELFAESTRQQDYMRFGLPLQRKLDLEWDVFFRIDCNACSFLTDCDEPMNRFLCITIVRVVLHIKQLLRELLELEKKNMLRWNVGQFVIRPQTNFLHSYALNHFYLMPFLLVKSFYAINWLTLNDFDIRRTNDELNLQCSRDILCIVIWCVI